MTLPGDEWGGGNIKEEVMERGIGLVECEIVPQVDRRLL